MKSLSRFFTKWLVVLGTVVCLMALPALAFAQGVTYTVQPGDSLIKIARKYNITADSIAKANNIQNVSLIRVGQVLVLPGVEAPTATPVAPTAAPEVVAPTAAPEVVLPVAPAAAPEAVLSAPQASSPVEATPVAVLVEVVPTETSADTTTEDVVIDEGTVEDSEEFYLPSYAPKPGGLRQNVLGPWYFTTAIAQSLDWLQQTDVAVYEFVMSRVTVIHASEYQYVSYAQLTQEGTCAVGMSLDVNVAMTASIIYHEALHCDHGLRGVSLERWAEEVYAYNGQLNFMRTHPGYLPEDIRVIELMRDRYILEGAKQLWDIEIEDASYDFAKAHETEIGYLPSGSDMGAE